ADAHARAAELAPAEGSAAPPIESSSPTKIEVLHEEAKDDGPAADRLIDTQEPALAQDVERPSALDSPRENNPAMAATSISLLSGASDIVADDIKEDATHMAVLQELEGIMASMEADLLQPELAQLSTGEAPNSRLEPLSGDDEALMAEILEDLEDSGVIKAH
ncbi:unnamed protein product, partial [Symbiodinium microadriaticum]